MSRCLDGVPLAPAAWIYRLARRSGFGLLIDGQIANRTCVPCPRPRGHAKHVRHAHEDEGMAHGSTLFRVRFAFCTSIAVQSRSGKSFNDSADVKNLSENRRGLSRFCGGFGAKWDCPPSADGSRIGTKMTNFSSDRQLREPFEPLPGTWSTRPRRAAFPLT